MLNDTFIVLLSIFIYINSFIIGYLLCRITYNGVVTTSPKSFFDKNKSNSSTIHKNDLSIDDKKFVTDIKTDGLERKFETLGNIKKTEEDISNSVNKLKNLKG